MKINSIGLASVRIRSDTRRWISQRANQTWSNFLFAFRGQLSSLLHLLNFLFRVTPQVDFLIIILSVWKCVCCLSLIFVLKSVSYKQCFIFLAFNFCQPVFRTYHFIGLLWFPVFLIFRVIWTDPLISWSFIWKIEAVGSLILISRQKNSLYYFISTSCRWSSMIIRTVLVTFFTRCFKWRCGINRTPTCWRDRQISAVLLKLSSANDFKLICRRDLLTKRKAIFQSRFIDPKNDLHHTHWMRLCEGAFDVKFYLQIHIRVQILL